MNNPQVNQANNESSCSCCTNWQNDVPEDTSLYRQFAPIALLLTIFALCFALLHSEFITTLDFMQTLLYVFMLCVYVFAGKPIFYHFWQNCKQKIFFDENTLMLFATLAALCIGEISEAVAVMLFFRVGEFLESLAIQRSKRSIDALLQTIPQIAHIEQNGALVDVHPDTLKKDDVIVIKVGEKIPTDSVIIEGKSYIDMRSINGESVPLSVRQGDNIIAGGINTNALIKARVSKPFSDSHIAQIAKLTKEASAHKAKTQKTITAFARVYTPLVFVFSLCVALIPPLFNGEWSEWIYRGLVVMMISCPCALVIAVPLGYFASIGRASREGVLFKGSIYLESLPLVKNIIFDKTGTLTYGSFEILNIYSHNGYTEQSLIELAAIAEQSSNHPIATCIKNYKHITAPHIDTYEEIAGKGVYVKCDKGIIIAGNAALLHSYNVNFTPMQTSHTIVYIAHNNIYAGHIIIGDKPKAELKEDLALLKKCGIKHFAILSGDNQANVDALAKDIGITHAYGDLLPAQKEAKYVELSSKWKGKCAFIGDGINDSIVLRRSDVGISINTGESSNDVSKESADIILGHNSLKSLAKAFYIAFHTRSITRQNITFALLSKLILVILGIMGIANMWMAVFGDVGVALLALLNAMRPPRIKKI